MLMIEKNIIIKIIELIILFVYHDVVGLCLIRG